MDPARGIAAIVVGVATGILSGLFGIGGGLISTPAIRLILGYPAIIAVGTPLAVIVPTTMTGAVAYARRGNLAIRPALLLGAIGAVGSVAGSYATAYVGGPTILVLTAVVLVYFGWRMLEPSRLDVGRESRPPARRLVALGLAAGLFSGFFGLGGGSILVPGLMRWSGQSIREAIGTSLVAITVIALPGVVVHAMLGHVDWYLTATLVVGVVPGALLGAKLAHYGDEGWLRIAFAVFLLVVAGVLAAGEIAGLR